MDILVETEAAYGYSNQSRFAKAVLRGGLKRIRPTQFRVDNNQSNSPINLLFPRNKPLI